MFVLERVREFTALRSVHERRRTEEKKDYFFQEIIASEYIFLLMLA